MVSSDDDIDIMEVLGSVKEDVWDIQGVYGGGVYADEIEDIVEEMEHIKDDVDGYREIYQVASRRICKQEAKVVKDLVLEFMCRYTVKRLGEIKTRLEELRRNVAEEVEASKPETPKEATPAKINTMINALETRIISYQETVDKSDVTNIR